MAEVFEIAPSSLSRWKWRQHNGGGGKAPRGRPLVIPPAARERIRACYTQHYGQWGPRILAAWCRREGLGIWSPTTIAALIADLKEEPRPKAQARGYEITASGVMWSEDGTGFREQGRKKELLVIQDEHARLKLACRLVDGPADETAVYENLARAFAEQDPPLVLKHDGGGIFHGQRIRQLLQEHQVVELTGPPGYPQYNGKKERSMRDIKSFERAMRRHGAQGTLRHRLGTALHDLNEERPRPILRTGERADRITGRYSPA